MPDDLARMVDDGRDALYAVAEQQRSWDAFRAGGPDNPQRRRAVFGIIGATKAKLIDLTMDLGQKAARRISGLGSWAKSFMQSLGAGHVAATMAATGTLDPSPVDLDAVVEQVAIQAGFFDRFRKGIASGEVLLNQVVGRSAAILGRLKDAGAAVAAGVLSRAGSYADSIWSGTERVIRDRMVREGFILEHRVLGSAIEHCEVCPAEAKKGFVRIGTLKAIGDSPCGIFCRCFFEYKTPAGLIVPSPLSGVATTQVVPKGAPPTTNPVQVAFSQANRSAVGPEIDATLDDTPGASDFSRVGKEGPILPGQPIGERIAAYRAGDGGRKIAALRAALESSEAEATPIRNRIDEIDRESDPIAAKLGLRGKNRIPADEREVLVSRSQELARERYSLQSKLEPLKSESLRAVFANLQVDDPLEIDRQQGDLTQHHGTVVRPSGPAAQRVVVGSELVTAITRKGDDQPALPLKYGMFDEYGRAFALLYPKIPTIVVDRMDSATIVVHEIGHVVESKLTSSGKPLVDRSLEFLRYRVGDEPIQSFKKVLGKNYGSDEKGRKDRFDEAFGDSGWYVGKEYGQFSSEIIAMGVQKLYEDPARFIDRDPEYASFVIAILDGSLR